MKNTLKVKLDNNSYPIYFNNSKKRIKSLIDLMLKEGKNVFLVTDKNIIKNHINFIKKLGIENNNIFVLEPGEETKSIKDYEKIISFLLDNKVNRDSSLFALGGGVIGDLTGFVAATILRGIDFYQIPTTLLSMVDSSVGGKTGINLKYGKNLVGAFWQPKAVYIDKSFLKTLPEKEFSSGMAEVIKYGLIKDKSFFKEISNLGKITKDNTSLINIIYRCCEIKSEIVSLDEKETNVFNGRSLLNLGHTFGHAIENASGYGEYLHGEAVSIGIHMASLVSEIFDDNFSKKETSLIKNILLKNNLPVKLKSSLTIKKLNKAISIDKKASSNGLKFVLLKKIGHAYTTKEITFDKINQEWKKIGAI